MKRLLALVLFVVAVPAMVRAGEAGWADKIKLSGDFRYRWETISDEADTTLEPKDDTYVRNRHRIRARLFLDATVSDEVAFGFSVATGPANDPVSTNQDLTGDFTNKPINIDLAYADIHPKVLKGLSLLAGKMRNPFLTVGRSELVWDHDLTPEGVAAKFSLPTNFGSVLLNGGYLWVSEIKNDADRMLLGFQGAVNGKVSQLTLTAGASYYTYTETENPEYTIIELMGEVGTNLGKIPATVFANYATNNDADEDNTGLMFGLSLGKKKNPGSWDFRYYYQVLELNAVNKRFCGSDFAGGGTNGKGHVISASVRVMKDADLGLTYYLNKKNIREGQTETDYNRMQADFSFKF